MHGHWKVNGLAFLKMRVLWKRRTATPKLSLAEAVILAVCFFASQNFVGNWGASSTCSASLLPALGLPVPVYIMHTRYQVPGTGTLLRRYQVHITGSL